MKAIIFSVLSFIFLANISVSQIQNSSSFDAKSGYWRIDKGDKSTGTLTNNPMYSWQVVQSPITDQIMGICFVDTLHGFVSDDNNGAMGTTDGGMTWTVWSINDTNFSGGYNSVYFINPLTGWCVGSALQIRKTTNAGANWFKQYSAPEQGIAHSVYFLDANTGFIFGSKNSPYVPYGEKTTNGGSNWSELSLSFSGAQELNKQYWINTSTCWVAGYNVLLESTNGGASFANYFANVPPTGNGYNDLLCIWFVNQQTGWIGGSNLDKDNIYITTNSGQNWTFQTNPVSQNNYYVQINDIYFLNADSGWAVHGTPSTGAIMFTSNAGTNWVMDEGANNWYQCITAIPTRKAWCGSSNGQIWYTQLNRLVGIHTTGNQVPSDFGLSQNYPNPFNPTTAIRFQIPSDGNVTLKVYDVLGREVSTVINENLSAGEHEVKFDASNLASGVYLYRIEAGSFSDVKKMLLIK